MAPQRIERRGWGQSRERARYAPALPQNSQKGGENNLRISCGIRYAWTEKRCVQTAPARPVSHPGQPNSDGGREPPDEFSTQFRRRLGQKDSIPLFWVRPRRSPCPWPGRDSRLPCTVFPTFGILNGTNPLTPPRSKVATVLERDSPGGSPGLGLSAAKESLPGAGATD